ncbi:hypothetical protein ACFMPD_14075 [Sedimentitalea sp. HM32M-2]
MTMTRGLILCLFTAHFAILTGTATLAGGPPPPPCPPDVPQC